MSGASRVAAASPPGGRRQAKRANESYLPPPRLVGDAIDLAPVEATHLAPVEVTHLTTGQVTQLAPSDAAHLAPVESALGTKITSGRRRMPVTGQKSWSCSNTGTVGA